MLHLAGLPLFYSSTLLRLSQACLRYIATDAPQPKEEVIDAAPQHKEEVDAIDDTNSPKIFLSHLPATEEVGGQQAFVGPCCQITCC